jgi:hypothetical protein
MIAKVLRFLIFSASTSLDIDAILEYVRKTAAALGRRFRKLTISGFQAAKKGSPEHYDTPTAFSNDTLIITIS